MDRLAHISEFLLTARLLAQRMDSSGALSGMKPRSVNMHSSSFFQILPRAQPSNGALSGWLAKPADWLSERMEIRTSQTCLINLKLRGTDY